MRPDLKFIWDVRTDNISGPYAEDGVTRLTLVELNKVGDFRLVDPPRALDINPGKYRVLVRLHSIPENRHYRRLRLARERRERFLEAFVASLSLAAVLVAVVIFLL